MSRLKDFNELSARAQEQAKDKAPLKLALTCAEDKLSLEAVYEAKEMGLVTPILLGDYQKIERIAEEAKIDLTGFQIIDECQPRHCVAEAASMVAQGDADLLMKGRIGAIDFLQAAIHKSIGLRQKKQVWTHVGIFWPEWLSRFLMVTDGGVVIDPDLDKIPGIINNAVKVANCLGMMKPKVGLLAAVEAVYPSMPVAMGGAVISKMAERGQIKNCLVDGPLSLDVALSADAAREKKVAGEVAGKADILVTNKIEVGNTLCKSIFIFGKARSAGLIVGPKNPIVLTSRSESAEAKINSIALATLMAVRD